MDIKNTFDNEATMYEFTSRAVNIYFDEALYELVSYIRTGEHADLKILDACCGTGILTKQVADRFPNAAIFGVDFSKGMLSVAKNRLKDYNFSALESDILDTKKMKELPMFDVIVSSFGIHNVHGRKNKQRALNNILAHLKSGGQFVVCDIIKGKDKAEQQQFEDFQRQWIRENYSEEETENWMHLLADEDDPETLENNFKLLESCDCEKVKLLWQKEFLVIFEGFKK